MLTDLLIIALYLAGFVFAVAWFGFFKSVISYKTVYTGKDRTGEFIASCFFALISLASFIASAHISWVRI